jgi:hypothetical protein
MVRILCVIDNKNALVTLIVVSTGRFITYSGITKIYYRKTVGHVFTKPVQIEGTTQKNFSPQ